MEIMERLFRAGPSMHIQAAALAPIIALHLLICVWCDVPEMGTLSKRDTQEQNQKRWRRWTELALTCKVIKCRGQLMIETFWNPMLCRAECMTRGQSRTSSRTLTLHFPVPL